MPFQLLEVIDVVAFDKWDGDRYGVDLVDEVDLNAKVAAMANILPSCVKQLTLPQASRITLLHALEILRIKNEKTKQLEKMRIVLDDWIITSDFPAEAEALFEAGAKYGVEVSVEESWRRSQNHVAVGYTQA